MYLPFLWTFGEYHFDRGPLVALAIGLTTLGMMLVAIGVFFSALARNQIVAFIGTFVTLFLLLMITILNLVVGPRADWADALDFLSIYMQVNDFASGWLDVRVLMLHLSAAAFLLFLAVKGLEWRRGA